MSAAPDPAFRDAHPGVTRVAVWIALGSISCGVVALLVALALYLVG